MPKPSEHLIEAANKFVAEFDKRDTNIYVSLAKMGLWLVSCVLVAVIIACVYRCVYYWGYNTAILTVIVEASQVLVVIAVTVMGWHGYRGSRIFHLLRHWNDGAGE